MSKEDAGMSLKCDDLTTSLIAAWRAHKDDRMAYELPRESATQTILAKRLSTILCEVDGCWLEITDWGAFPNAINYDLFYGYRLGRGDGRMLKEASVYSFLPGDTDQFTSILSMILYFSWDAWIFNADRTYVIEISNDEIIDFFSESSNLRAELASEFVRLKMRALSAP